MTHKQRWRARAAGALAVAGLAMVPAAQADHGTGTGQSFTFLQSGFTQELIGVTPSFIGGVAFAADGDPVVDRCEYNSPLSRFDLQSTPTAVHGSNIHIRTDMISNAGCGLTNHLGGGLFTNAGNGVITGPGLISIDAGAFKDFAIRESLKFRIQTQIRNFPNHANLGVPEGNLNSANYGRITSLNGSTTARIVVVGARFTF